jgi:DNA-binding GntR family transcriptional regulator
VATAKKSANRESPSRGASSRKALDARPRGSGASLVRDKLREEILNLTIAPGSLLDESELAARFGLSRSPVREALIRLSAEGLIQMLPNRSPVVTPFDIAEVPSYFDALELMYRATCRLAAIYRTDAELADIIETEKRLEQAQKRGEHELQLEVNRDFHMRIAEAGGNPVFANWLAALLANGQRLMRLGIFFGGDRPVDGDLSDHERIINAIRKQDPEAADAAGRRDADILRNRFLRELAVRNTSPMSLGDTGTRSRKR